MNGNGYPASINGEVEAVSEKQLALVGATITLILATMSGGALLTAAGLNQRYSELKESSGTQASLIAQQGEELARLNAVVIQLRDNTLMLQQLLKQRQSDDPAQPYPSGPMDGAKPASEAERDTPSSVIPPISQPLAPTRPAAATPPGVKIYPVKESTFLPTAKENGAPQASRDSGETILAALQAPSTGLKTHPRLDPTQGPSIVSVPIRPKRLESVDDLLVEKIISNWQRPKSARDDMTVEVLIRMSRDGIVKSAKVAKSSGDRATDLAATKAILAVKKIPEMSQVSDEAYNKMYRERQVALSPKNLIH